MIPAATVLFALTSNLSTSVIIESNVVVVPSTVRSPVTRRVPTVPIPLALIFV